MPTAVFTRLFTNSIIRQAGDNRYDVQEAQRNAHLNRYMDILPYNWNYITVDANGPKYVNASMIKSSLTLPPEMQMPEKTYIAAQGPLKTTIDDFWHTVDQMNVSVVVMLAKLVENQRTKCEKYWPDIHYETTDGALVITQLSQNSITRSIIERRFRIQRRGSLESREVVQLHFQGWPDHGVPASAAQIVDLVKRGRQLNKTNSPMLVHCSAGVGRTGTFCAIDLTIHLLEHHPDKVTALKQKLAVLPGKIDDATARMVDELAFIHKIILQLRLQRPYMVEAVAQYEFCYKAIITYLRQN